MAWQLAAIRLKSQWNQLRSQTWILVLSILGYLYALAVITGVGIGMIVTSINAPALATLILPTVGIVFTAGWIVFPVVFSSAENTLAPPKLAPFVAATPRLARSILLATLAGVTGVFLLLAAGIQLAGWFLAQGAAAGVTSILSAVLGIVTCLAWSRVVTTTASKSQSSRSGRDRAGLIGFVVILLVFVPLMMIAPILVDEVTEAGLARVLEVLQWTPLGAAWTLPAAVAAGQWGIFAGQLAIAMGTAALGVWLWTVLLPPAMYGHATALTEHQLQTVRTAREGHSQKRESTRVDSPQYLRSVDRWERLGVPGPAASIAARQKIYWWKDPRLSAQLISALLLFILAAVWPFVSDRLGEMSDSSPDFSTGYTLGMLSLAALLLGQLIGTLLQFDSTAFWVQVASDTRGRDDRLGRFLGSLIPTAGFLLVGTLICGFVMRLDATMFLALLLGSFTLYGCSAATTLVIGAQWIYPVQTPGANPMTAKGTGYFVSTMVITTLSMLAAAIVGAIPVAVLVIALNFGAIALIGAAILAIVWTAGALWLGIYWGGRVLDASKVELLTKMASWPGHGVSA